MVTGNSNRGSLKLNRELPKRKIAIIILVIFGIICFTPPFNNLISKILQDEKTSQYMTELSVRAGATFAIARGLNGIISVAQSISLDFIASVDIGEILDPLNDLVEKFSDVMLLSLASVGIQIIVLHIGQAIGVRCFLSLALLFAAITNLGLYLIENKKLGKIFREKMYSFSSSLWKTFLILFFILRLFVPLVAFIGWSTEPFVMDKYDQATEELTEVSENSKKELDDIQNDEDVEVIEENTGVPEELDAADSVDSEKKGVFSFITNSVVVSKAVGTVSELGSKIGEKVSGVVGSISIKQRLTALIDSLTNIVSYVVDLIIVFVIQTILIPIAALFIMRIFFWPFVKNIFEKGKAASETIGGGKNENKENNQQTLLE